MIKKKGHQWILYSGRGTKILGKFRTRKAALQRERQIQYFKRLEK